LIFQDMQLAAETTQS